MAVMGITEALANPAVLHGHQVNQAAAEAEKSFNGWRLHDAVSAQPPNASVRVNVKPHMGVGLIGILYWEKMQSSSVVARLQLSHWNKGLPLIGLVDLVYLGSLKHVCTCIFLYQVLLLYYCSSDATTNSKTTNPEF